MPVPWLGRARSRFHSSPPNTCCWHWLVRCTISANLFIDVFRAPPYAPGMATVNAAQEDWNVLVSFFPSNWKQLAQETQALKGLRQDKSEENYLRVLLLHLGCGFSLRETVARAKQ